MMNTECSAWITASRNAAKYAAPSTRSPTRFERVIRQQLSPGFAIILLGRT
jgi:hypothetical protein